MALAVYFLAALVVLLVWWYNSTRLPANFPPGPGFRLPLIGHLLSLGSGMSKGFTKLRQRYGDIYGLYLGPIRVVVLSSHELIQEAFGMEEFSFRPEFETVHEARGGMPGRVTPGIIHSNGPEWSKQRRFTLQKLKDFGFGKQSMEEFIAEEVQGLCRHLEKESSGGKPINIQTGYNIAVLNALWRICTGERHEYDSERVLMLVKLLNDFTATFSKPVYMLGMQYAKLNKLLTALGFDEFQTMNSLMNGLTRECIRTHEETFQDDSERDFIDSYLAQMKKAEGDTESSFHKEKGTLHLNSILLDMFIAGGETTSSTLNWATLYMANNQDVQRKMQTELDKAFGRNGTPTYSERGRTPYTEAVIQEIFRISHVITMGVPHCTKSDVVFRGYLIPKDTQVFTDIGAVSRDPNNFADPHEFRPERFYDAAARTFKPSQMVIPLGLGKRRCPGETLARVEMYMFLTGIVHHFTVLPERDGVNIDTEPKEGFVSLPHPYRVRFVARS